MAPRTFRTPSSGMLFDGDLEVAGDITIQGQSKVGRVEHRTAEVTAALSTVGAVTTFPTQIPAGSILKAIAIKVNTIVAGVNSTGFDVAFAGNLDKAIASAVPIAVLNGGTGWRISVPLPPADDFFTQGVPPTPFADDPTDVTITLVGGADNTPSAGNLTVLVDYEYFGPPA